MKTTAADKKDASFYLTKNLNTIHNLLSSMTDQTIIVGVSPLTTHRNITILRRIVVGKEEVGEVLRSTGTKIGKRQLHRIARQFSSLTKIEATVCDSSNSIKLPVIYAKSHDSAFRFLRRQYLSHLELLNSWSIKINGNSRKLQDIS